MSKINNTKIINDIEQQQQKAMPLDLDNSHKPINSSSRSVSQIIKMDQTRK
jgi:DNA-binding transcriptional regulator WhiA